MLVDKLMEEFFNESRLYRTILHAVIDSGIIKDIESVREITKVLFNRLVAEELEKNEGVPKSKMEAGG